MGKFKKKASELKAWYKKNEIGVLAVGTAVVGSVGWALAGYYQGKAIKAESMLEGIREARKTSWPTIEVHPELMEDFENGDGGTLRLRLFEMLSGGVYVQGTTEEDGFTPEAEEFYNQNRKPRATEETTNA